jgi:hypothetical protein
VWLEAEADWSALQRTRDPRGDDIPLQALYPHHAGPAHVPDWATLLLDDHPAPLRRIEMAAAWERLHQRR